MLISKTSWFLARVCTFSPWLHVISPGTRASSHIPKMCMWGELACQPCPSLSERGCGWPCTGRASCSGWVPTSHLSFCKRLQPSTTLNWNKCLGKELPCFYSSFLNVCIAYNCFNAFLKLNLLGWRWLIRLYRFQVYSSMIHDLYIALCTHHPESNLLPSPYIWSPLPFTTPLPLPSGKQHTVVYVYKFLLIFLVCSDLLLSLLYFTYEWNNMVFNFFWLTSLSIIFSRSIHVVANGSISSFLMAEEYSIIYIMCFGSLFRNLMIFFVTMNVP